MGIDRNQWPLMVRLGLRGMPTRAVARAYVAANLAMIAGIIAYGAFKPVPFPIKILGILLGLGAPLGHFSIRWVDRHGGW